MMLRQAFLGILLLLLPWSCQCLLANIANRRFSDPLVSFLGSTSLRATEVLDLESEESDQLSGNARQGNILRQDNSTGTHLTQQSKQQIYLFSLNWIKESDPEYFRKKDVRRLWEWKDGTLGDGRDFFVPKPKTLMALQQYFLENIPSMVECSIISNCARLEVLCSYSCRSSDGENKNEKQQQDLLAREISNCFIAQLNHQRSLSKKSNAWTKMVMQLPVNMDRPESVLTREPPVVDAMKTVRLYDSWWNVTVGPRAILTHVCKVSAGMGRRPRRPDRPVIFRPYSSRDAHVLLQLKRTRENIGFSTATNAEGRTDRKRKLLPIVLDYALRAGKAARNSDIVPDILELKEMTSAESSVGSASEQQTSERVAEAAFEKGIKPLILECVAKLDDSTNNTEQTIAEFRRNALQLLNEIEPQYGSNDDQSLHQELRSWLNRKLHEPTIQLRSLARQQSGDDTDRIESYLRNSLQEIQNELRKEQSRLRNLEGRKIELIC